MQIYTHGSNESFFTSQNGPRARGRPQGITNSKRPPEIPQKLPVLFCFSLSKYHILFWWIPSRRCERKIGEKITSTFHLVTIAPRSGSPRARPALSEGLREDERQLRNPPGIAPLASSARPTLPAPPTSAPASGHGSDAYRARKMKSSRKLPAQDNLERIA